VTLAGSPVGVRLKDERGAIVVHVALAFAGLLAFSALTVDLGVLWASRAQAQNAADSGAMAGAVSLAYGAADKNIAEAAAVTVAQANTVWGEVGAVASTADQPCPAGSPESAGDCVRVEVSRGGQDSVPLPVFFGRLIGAVPEEVRATATAKVFLGNTTNCLKPWALQDRWLDLRDAPIDGELSPDDVFDYFDPSGALLPSPRDEYVAPTETDPGTSYGRADFTRTVTIDSGRPDLPLELRQFLLLDLPRDGTGTGDRDQLMRNIATCSGGSAAIGDTVTVDANLHPNDSRDGAQELIARDPDAQWDGQRITGSLFPVSPRLVAIAVFDPLLYQQTDRVPVRFEVTIRNIVGFFVQSSEDRSVTGVLLPLPGSYAPTKPELSDQSAFLRSVGLVR
jgi:hypothetical protein